MSFYRLALFFSGLAHKLGTHTMAWHMTCLSTVMTVQCARLQDDTFIPRILDLKTESTD